MKMHTPCERISLVSIPSVLLFSHTDGDDTTSLSVTLGIRHTHRHSASKRS